jgi:hypothetical protein
MSSETNQAKNQSAQGFSEQAGMAQPGIIREFWDFLLYNKKWWLTPVILVLILMAILVVFGLSSPAAPFIYTLF